jgi:hypothetical protein
MSLWEIMHQKKLLDLIASYGQGPALWLLQWTPNLTSRVFYSVTCNGVQGVSFFCARYLLFGGHTIGPTPGGGSLSTLQKPVSHF